MKHSIAVVLFASLLVLSCGEVNAEQITYYVKFNEKDGKNQVFGSISTDGTLGSLTAKNIKRWEFHKNGWLVYSVNSWSSNTRIICSANTTSSPCGLTATKTSLNFDFDSNSGSFLSFSMEGYAIEFVGLQARQKGEIGHIVSGFPDRRPIVYCKPCNKIIGTTTLTHPDYRENTAIELFYPVERSALDRAETEELRRIRERPATEAVKPVRLNLKALLSSLQTQISLSDDRVLVFIPYLREPLDGDEPKWKEKGFFWNAGGGDQGSALLMVRGNVYKNMGIVTGSIRIGGEFFRIVPIQSRGVHAVVKINLSKLPIEHLPNTGREKRGSGAGVGPPRVDKRPSQVVIDVAVAYTKSAQDVDSADLEVDITNAIYGANRSYIDSGIHLKLNNVATFPFYKDDSGKDYDDRNKTTDTILDDLIATQWVNQRRNQLGVDVVVLVVSNFESTKDCGASYRKVDASRAFSVVFVGCLWTKFSLPHEIGHLIGADHDLNKAVVCKPGDKQCFPYGHGYQYKPKKEDPKTYLRTIMAYNCEPPLDCVLKRRWSTPKLEYKYHGKILGDASTADNARVLNERAYIVADFKTGPARFIFGTSGIYDGNLGGPEGADKICQKEADEHHLSGTYKAWLSTGNREKNPASTFEHATVPYISTDLVGTELAANWNTLTTSGPSHAIMLADGTPANEHDTYWTATNEDGTSLATEKNDLTCVDWAKNGSGKRGQVGGGGSPHSSWTVARKPDKSTTWYSCDSKLRLYCVEQVTAKVGKR